ncbi:phage tail protein [Citrobacter portucalensis]|uniref:phage tail protein n=1 Tax=Citrobacter portucalensis TaxID=1639133 RepID=UPI001C63C9AE|nr:phage tail protein [Citrobacter portucalensis]MBW7622369.1 phage tail protein [Citrobacter portucalensis]MBW7641321.1 phage tail protein [Citrobacter portucalensis]MCA2135794.1 phage tail protein [Citrobacter portucalensis]
MPTNDIKPFAVAGGANVLTQAEYLALAALSTGFSSGKANSKEVNKAIRQATFIASVLAQFICDKSGSDVLDDGNVAGLVTKLLSAINKTSQPLDATLTALAGLVGAANKLPYFNGNDTAALTDLTSVGRDIIGKTDIAAVLQYLGLGAGAPPIGIPFFWPSASMPNTVMPEWDNMVFLKLNGSTFSASTYPKLALVWPGLRLTESRGEFIRAWDDGRGVDNGRSLLSAQLDALQDITGSIEVSDNTGIVGGIRASSGAFTMINNTGSVPVWSSTSIPGVRYSTANFSAANVARTAQETRSRNIAFNFLVRAK